MESTKENTEHIQVLERPSTAQTEVPQEEREETITEEHKEGEGTHPEDPVSMIKAKGILEYWGDKKEQFVRLKEWEDGRRTGMHLLMRLSDGIITNVIKQLHLGDGEILAVLNYLLSFVAIEKDHSLKISKNLIVLQPIHANYQKHGKEFSTFIGAIQGFDREHAFKKNEFCKMVETKHVETIRNLHEEYISKIRQFESENSKRKKVVEKELKTSEKYFNAHCMLMSEIETGLLQEKVPQKDLFMSERKFEFKAKAHMAAVKQYCLFCLELWNAGHELEKKRMETIKRTFEELYFSYSQTLYPNEQLLGMLTSFQRMNMDLVVREILSLKNLLDERINEFIQKFKRNVTAEGNTEVSEEEIKTYLGEYEYEQAPKSPFIVKEGLMKRDPGVFKSWRENFAIITTDRFLHFFNNAQEEKPCVTFNLTRTEVQTKNPKVHKSVTAPECFFELLEKKKGVFSSNQKAYLMVNSKEEMGEWVSLIVDNT